MAMVKKFCLLQQTIEELGDTLGQTWLAANAMTAGPPRVIEAAAPEQVAAAMQTQPL